MTSSSWGWCERQSEPLARGRWYRHGKWIRRREERIWYVFVTLHSVLALVLTSEPDIVLTDDNFASIIAAIREGRRSFDNIKSFALHLLAGNVGQAIVLMVGLAFKDQENLSVFPLSPGASIAWL